MDRKTDYEANIDSLIPKAVGEASRRVETHGRASESRVGARGQYYNHCFWTEFFHDAMNRMAREAGYR